MRINDYLARGQAWAITRESLETVLAIANREGDVEALLKQRGEQPDNTFKVEIRDGIGVMAIDGPIFPKANLFSMISGATSVDLLATNLGELENNPAVKAIVLNIDSPGGNVKGINEFAGLVKASSKPVFAYVSGTAASAAYWIASAAQEIIIDKTAALGSIGVVATYRKADAKDQSIEIVSSNAPDKRPDVETDAGRALIQQMIDDTEAVFIETVMQNRQISREQVTNLRGGIVIGAKAVNAGLADRLGSLESILLELNNIGQSMDLATLKADHNDLYQAVFKEGAVSAQADGVKAERERISAILNHDEAQGREAQAKVFAFETDMAADMAVKLLAAAPMPATIEATTGDQFSQHMAKLGNPDIGAGSETEQPNAIDTQASWGHAFANVVPMKGGKR